MTREEVLSKVKSIKNKNLLLTLPTGFGKSRIAIERVKSVSENKSLNLLIVVPRNVLKITWAEELKKWWSNCNLNITYTTYVSLPKYAGKWDFVIFDEAHHLSERCIEALSSFNIDSSLLLSATVKRDLKKELFTIFNNLYYLNITLREAITDEVLPDPKVYLLPLTLDNTHITEYIIRNKKARGRVIYCSFKDRWIYIRQKYNPVYIHCTQAEYIKDLNDQIEYFKNRRGNIVCKNMWLRLCGDRLKYLSDKKTTIVYNILKKLSKYRTLTFCNSIEQTELLGKYCINSKNLESSSILNKFNKGIIDHITACNMLNEGTNLVNCRIGIYANLNSSETIVKQRTGRLLRHPNPIIIIPYYKNTREEELVTKMLEDYNPELVRTINFIEEIEL